MPIVRKLLPLLFLLSLSAQADCLDGRGAEVPAANLSLKSRIRFWEERLERKFRPVGPVINLRVDSDRDELLPVIELKNGTEVSAGTVGDSTLWTGVDLGAQCMKYAVSTREGNRAEADEASRTALDLMTVLERHLAVTGVPGTLARFAFDPSTEYAKRAFSQVDTSHPSFRDHYWFQSQSPAYKGWIWQGDTSRDSYTGPLFGMAVCHQLMPDRALRSRIDRFISQLVRGFVRNHWKLPNLCTPSRSDPRSCPTGFDPYAQGMEEGDLKLAYLRFMKVLHPKGEPYPGYSADLRAATLGYQFFTEVDTQEYNNIVEHYGFNLRWLRNYALMILETDEKYKDMYRDFAVNHVWKATWFHQNAFYTFLKIGAFGVSDLERDRRALQEGRHSLEALTLRDRRSCRVENSKNPSIGRDKNADAALRLISTLEKYASEFLRKKVDLRQKIRYLRKFAPLANRVLDIRERPPADFFWQKSPKQLDGGEPKGYEQTPALDVVIAYWLGRYHRLIGAEE